MNVEYGTACATSASGVHNLGGGVRGVCKSGVRISPLPARRRRGRRRLRSWRTSSGTCATVHASSPPSSLVPPFCRAFERRHTWPNVHLTPARRAPADRRLTSRCHLRAERLRERRALRCPAWHVAARNRGRRGRCVSPSRCCPRASLPAGVRPRRARRGFCPRRPRRRPLVPSTGNLPSP